MDNNVSALKDEIPVEMLSYLKEQLNTVLESESALSSKIDSVEISLNRSMLDLKTNIQEQFTMVMSAVDILKTDVPNFSKKEEEHH